MIQAFFEKELDVDGQMIDNSHYFTGMKIMDAGETYTSQMGKYPVITLSLKAAKQADFDTAYESLMEQIADEYKRHCYILQSENILEEDKVRYRNVMAGKGRYVDYVLSLHFLSGCLKKDGQRFEDDTLYVSLSIPNKEVRTIYRRTIREWFDKKIEIADLAPFYKAIINGDCKIIEEVIKKHLRDSISFWDSKENFYHGFMLGLLTPIQGYTIKSNFEGGEGRFDLALVPEDELLPAVFLEFKHCKKFSEMDVMSSKALIQIEDRHYTAELEEESYDKIIKYGICFCKKSCKVKSSEII